MAGESRSRYPVVHEPSREFVESTNVRAFMEMYDIDDHDALIARTTRDVPGVEASGLEWFWDELIDYLGLTFDTDYETVRDDTDGPQFSDWYPGGELNIAHNTLDRHPGADTALLWEGEPGDTERLTYADLRHQSNRVANYLRARDVEPGDTVGLYMPMIPEVAAVLYGCFEVGAIAVPVFSGFGVDATATRLADSDPDVLFTADGFHRRGHHIDLKADADAAVEQAGGISHVVVADRLDTRDDPDRTIPWVDGRDEWWADAVATQPAEFETRSLPSDQKSMLLYSSGTTGEPKGIVHTHAGALVQAAKEVYFGFDLKPGDRFFWLSDIGWMMGPWALIGTHAHGETAVMYEGAPDHPQPDRLWSLIERHEVTQFGVSPTAVRALREHGDQWVDQHDLSSLRLLGSTGEPWDEASWRWFYERVGGGETPIINISGGTELMGCFLMPMPTQPLKPCSLGGPGLGMAVDIVNEAGESVADSHERGYLVARDSCPSMTKSLWGGDERYLAEYWSRWDGLWNHGDWAQVDEDGFWFLHGRADDALNVAGRKVGPAEIEDVLAEHEGVTESVVVGVPDETTGTAVVAFVVPDGDADDGLAGELRALVGAEQGKPFRPRDVYVVEDLPRTQSGKLIRRAVRAVTLGDDPGDLSSMENPDALDAVRHSVRDDA